MKTVSSHQWVPTEELSSVPIRVAYILLLTMLQPILHVLNQQKIVLASGSPRRKEILSHVGLKFEVNLSNFPETLNPAMYRTHSEYAMDTAFNKVLEVSERVDAGLIIGADTVVSLNNKVYEKPTCPSHAVTMLTELSGRQHTVCTGVVLLKNGKCTTFSEETLVTMADLPLNVIEAYVNSGESLDKAGGYGIQGMGGSLIKKIDGDFFNVMGLPLHRFCIELLKLYQY